MFVLTDKLYCVGCGACTAACPKGCISMRFDNEGFLYPYIDADECVECGACGAVCPVYAPYTADGQPEAFTAADRDNDIKRRSSSGGIFFRLAERFIDEGGVVVGAAMTPDNRGVKHIPVYNIEDIGAVLRSKYVQSSTEEAYAEVLQALDAGKKVLYCSTPCQVAGLKKLTDSDRLYTVDFICHGVPSPKAWRKYIEARKSEAGAPVSDVNFRDKRYGWQMYSMSIGFADGGTYTGTKDEDSFLRAFRKDICLRPSCHECRFKTISRVSDITLGDNWAAPAGNTYAEAMGSSVVFTHTEKGVVLFEAACGDKADIKKADASELAAHNAAMIKSAPAHARRNEFFELLDELTFDEAVRRTTGQLKFSERLKIFLKKFVLSRKF